MDFEVPSYLGKEFTVLDNKSIIRNPQNLSQSSRYKTGEHLPEGKKYYLRVLSVDLLP